jgi:hypothetical protein
MKFYLIILYLISVSKCTLEDSKLSVQCLLKNEDDEIGSVTLHQLDTKKRILVIGKFSHLPLNSSIKLFIYSGKVDPCSNDAMDQIYLDTTLTPSYTNEQVTLDVILPYTGDIGNACMLNVVDIDPKGVTSTSNHCGRIISTKDRLRPQQLQYRNLEDVGGGGGRVPPNEVFTSYSGEVVSETDLAQRNSTDDTTTRNLTQRKSNPCDANYWWCLTDWWIFRKSGKDVGK